jgi:hypothetical protein
MSRRCGVLHAVSAVLLQSFTPRPTGPWNFIWRQRGYLKLHCGTNWYVMFHSVTKEYAKFHSWGHGITKASSETKIYVKYRSKRKGYVKFHYQTTDMPGFIQRQRGKRSFTLRSSYSSKDKVTCRIFAWLIDGFRIGWLDLLTSYSHNSGLQEIMGLPLIYTLYSSPLHTH